MAQTAWAGQINLAPFPPPAPTRTTDDDNNPIHASAWRRWGKSPAAAARALVRDELTYEEKLGLVQGYPTSNYQSTIGYVGAVRGIARLGLPSSNMHDAGCGFRTLQAQQVGQVTAFPSSLAAAATWDPTAMYNYAAAIAAEFRLKGANVILGPSVNVHRVALNGRNAEYLSGEDPYLGAPLAAAYVRGAQSMGVACTVKHWILNSQETHRESQSSDADERVLMEVYMPPFKAAVDAGVAAVMCGYNRLNGSWVCGGDGDGGRLLTRTLRRTLGFNGFVVTDWWALHEAAAATRGVDQEEPGSLRNSGQGYFTQWGLESAGADIDGMAERVLTGMFMAGAFDPPVDDATGTPRGTPRCEAGSDECQFYLYTSVATSDAHRRVARTTAAQSIVLMKNEGGVLPLKKGGSLALLGSACHAPFLRAGEGRWDAADMYTMGGSARVISADSVASTVQNGLGERRDDLGVISVHAYDDAHAAWELARGHDVAIACAGGTATEGRDRPTLDLDQDGFLQDLVQARTAAAAAAAGASDADDVPPLVVIALAPGAFTAEWAGGVHAALAAFLTGQETGRAIADVLFGDVNPSAKLPVTVHTAASAAHTVPVCWADRCPYSEGLRAGWKGAVGLPVAFPFGHGLSYSGAFAYAWRHRQQPPTRVTVPGGAGASTTSAEQQQEEEAAVLLTLWVVVTNAGAVAGAEVAQLYLAFPPSAAEPPRVLRGYRKTEVLEPGESAEVAFGLTREGLSTWVAGAGWRVAAGTFVAHVGTSSRNTTLAHSFEVVAA